MEGGEMSENLLNLLAFVWFIYTVIAINIKLTRIIKQNEQMLSDNYYQWLRERKDYGK